MSEVELLLLWEMVENASYQKGDILFEEGQVVPRDEGALYLLRFGELARGEKKMVKGDYFNEHTLLGDRAVIQASIRATKFTTCGIVTAELIKSIIGDLEKLDNPEKSVISHLEENTSRHSIEKRELLGSGTFGKVWLVENTETKVMYALKIQPKRQIIDYKQVEAVIRERNILAAIRHPFIITLTNVYQDNTYLYMVLQFIQGGELASVMNSTKTNCLSEKSARFYASCIIEALSYMHSRRILYRDLKPANVLIDSNGYCVLVDLGFAKLTAGKTHTTLGTPLYIAPEIILSRGHDKGADYWAFGVLLFEMMFGYSAFYSKGISQTTLFKRIVKASYSFPDLQDGKKELASSSVIDLIKQLLVANPSTRLGSHFGGANDIKHHPFFGDTDYDELLRKNIKAPWVPEIKSSMDIDHFDENEPRLDDIFDMADPTYEKLSAHEQTLFEKF